MSNYHYAAQHYSNSMPHHSHSHSHSHNHHGRSRRGPRVSLGQNTHRQQFAKAQRSPKEVPENPAYNAYMKDLEAARGFDFEDDEVFCPLHLLTEDDLHSIHSSSSSDRSSLSSGSPEASPLQQSAQPTPSFLLSTPSQFNHNAFHQNNTSAQQQQQHQQQQRMKLHQPMAQRTRNAIPIVDPSTRTIASPPPSVSPARQMQHQYGRRW